MDGVTILNTYQSYSWGWSLILMTAIVAAVICFFISLAFLDEDVIISGFFGGLCIVLIIACLQIPRTITNHQIIVDDSVSWKELTKHYKIISIRGQILNVYEKEQKNDTH